MRIHWLTYHKKISFFLCFILVVIGTNVLAQGKTTTVTGFILDSIEKKPLSFATIGLYKPGNETKPLYNTYANDKGNFHFSKIDSGSYVLIITHAGYKEKKIPVITNYRENTIELNAILLTLAAENLQGVTVITRKQLVEFRDDGISYNAELDPMAASEKAIDLLKKTPMVSVDPSGKIEINGQASFKVLLNGRETAMFSHNLTEALKSFPGIMISRIDVITNPSAKYDAEGVAGLINIITKKKVIGYNGTLSIGVNTTRNKDINSTLNFKKGKYGVAVIFSAGGYNGLLSKQNETIEALVPSVFISRISKGDLKQNSNSVSSDIEFAFEPDSLNTFSLYSNFNIGKNEDHYTNDFTITRPSLVEERSQFTADKTFTYPSWSVGMDYIHKFKKNNSRELSLKYLADFSNDKNDDASIQLNQGASNRFIIDNSQARDRQYTFQGDYVQPLKKKIVLEAGGKIIFRRASSDYQSSGKYNASDIYIINQQNSDIFKYAQNVYSLYSSLKLSVKKINYRFGLRLEHTEVDGDFISSRTKVTQNYSNVIPNILFSTQLKKRQKLSLGYSIRLNRPYIRDLNPFINNTDSLSVMMGNPNLKPQLFHTINLQYGINKKNIFVNINLTNSFSNSNIIFLYRFDAATGISTLTRENNGTSNLTSLNLSINAKPTPQWQFNSNNNAGYYIFTNKVTQQKNSGFIGRIGLNSSYTFTEKISASLSTNYYFPTILLQGHTNGYLSYGVGLQSKFLKSKLVGGCYIGNLFNKEGFVRRVNFYEDVNFKRERVTYSPFRIIDFNLTWNFGKLREDVSKKRGVQNTDLL